MFAVVSVFVGPSLLCPFTTSFGDDIDHIVQQLKEEEGEDGLCLLCVIVSFDGSCCCCCCSYALSFFLPDDVT